jgi:hypothetical protein
MFSFTKVTDMTRPKVIPNPNAQSFTCGNYSSRHICSTSHAKLHVRELLFETYLLYESFQTPTRKASRAGITLRGISALRVTSSFIWTEFLGRSNCPFSHMAGITLNRHSALRVISSLCFELVAEITHKHNITRRAESAEE